MCVTVTSYYLVCGHARYRPVDCFKAAQYAIDLSTEYCTSRIRCYTELIKGTCEECTFLLGQENLRFRTEDDPLIWMNQIYRAANDEEPGEYDQAVNDTVDLIISADQRKKTILKRTAKTMWWAWSDQRRFNKKQRVACPTPYDIFSSKQPQTGNGTPGAKVKHGHFGRKLVNGVMRVVAIDDE